ncbi:MAG: type IA DNA topoisomerase [Lachnospiraceae bacterium]|nr:type IA DNA topoisomerase [Lachnospiraceae bacterium]
MAKALYITEKPSVAQEFAKALGLKMNNHNGYKEADEAIVTWCVGHLVTMSYPEVYDEKYKKWSLSTLPFLPEEFLYEVIPSAANQYKIVAWLLKREDVDTIYVCTDSGREGEYIYRLVEQQAGIKGKKRKRVWIDSQTEEEILRGIREAKDLSEYDNLSDSAYLRAKEDYLMGINFSRLLTLKYGNAIANYLHERYAVISVGRVMTCVQGMVVRREREIRNFVKTPFYRVQCSMDLQGTLIEGEWKAVEGSRYFQSPKLYKENGFLKQADAKELISSLSGKEQFLENETGLYQDTDGLEALIWKVEKKKEQRKPPLLYNLAELQNDCSKFFKISPDETLRVVQELYEKKLVTYPRTDARVLSVAVSKEITKNIKGLLQIPGIRRFAEEILQKKSYQGLAKTRYVNDKQITDHYAIIPTGQGIGAIKSLSVLSVKIYEVISRKFLAIFYPPAIYQKINIVAQIKEEKFFANFKMLIDPGYLQVMEYSFFQKKKEENGTEQGEEFCDKELLEKILAVKKGVSLPVRQMMIKEGETTPPKRYNSGSMILAMENAGQLIEDEELRAQIKGSGIGTSATRAEILKKLVNNKYLALNKKTQIITPTQLGEMIYDVVDTSIRPLLNPELTASWEKGLTYVAEGSLTTDEYMVKLEGFIKRRTDVVLNLRNQYALYSYFDHTAEYYKKKSNIEKNNAKKKSGKKSEKRKEGNNGEL